MFQIGNFDLCRSRCRPNLMGRRKGAGILRQTHERGRRDGWSLRKDSTTKDYAGVAKDAEKFGSVYAEAKTFWDARHDETASGG